MEASVLCYDFIMTKKLVAEIGYTLFVFVMLYLALIYIGSFIMYAMFSDSVNSGLMQLLFNLAGVIALILAGIRIRYLVQRTKS